MRDSYGDVTSEYRAVTETVAVVKDAHDLVWVEGRDAVKFLQGILSQDIEAIPVGGVARSFFLGPQGKLRAMLRVARGDERVALVVDAGQGDTLAADLDYYRIRIKAEIRSEDRPIREFWGPSAATAAGLGVDAGWETREDTVLLSAPMRGLDRVVVIGDESDTGTIPMAGRLATWAARVEFGEPVFGIDVDESTIPQETGLVDGSVSFTKGCYLGQELVARIDSRGRVNRHLRSLAVTRNVLPPERASVFDGEREVGTITSVSETLTSPVGLTLLRREVEVGSEVTVRWDSGETPAIVRAVPVTDPRS